VKQTLTPEELIQKFNLTGPEQRTGTHCTCGAHTSVRLDDGGKGWLLAHVAETHAEAVDWPAVIREAIAMEEPAQGMAFLDSLVNGDKKETLADA
jgi:hypothetical protein